jgi:DNA-binding NarL/FixJ family response regulator
MSIQDLNDRHVDVLNELAKGNSNKEIARNLDIAPGTVKVHLTLIYRLLGVKSRTEALVSWLNHKRSQEASQ